jgi:hypothetical protein
MAEVAWVEVARLNAGAYLHGLHRVVLRSPKQETCPDQIRSFGICHDACHQHLQKEWKARGQTHIQIVFPSLRMKVLLVVVDLAREHEVRLSLQIGYQVCHLLDPGWTGALL